MTTKIIRTYSELITFDTFEDRFRYLRLQGVVGEDTFGFQRWLNQVFYTSREWRTFRRDIIVRDNGCDLGVDDRAIHGLIIIHHLNPISLNDLHNRNIDTLLNPENVICVSQLTHNAIHYGNESLLAKPPVERTKNDTCPWKRH